MEAEETIIEPEKIVVGMEFSPDIEKIKCVLVNTINAREIQIFWLHRTHIDSYDMYLDNVITGQRIGRLIRHKGRDATPHTWYVSTPQGRTEAFPGLRAASEYLGAMWFQAKVIADAEIAARRNGGN